MFANFRFITRNVKKPYKISFHIYFASHSRRQEDDFELSS